MKINWPVPNLMDNDRDINESIVDEYFDKLPPELKHIPKSILQHWILYHRRQFFEYWEKN